MGSLATSLIGIIPTATDWLSGPHGPLVFLVQALVRDWPIPSLFMVSLIYFMTTG
ncbi:MAG: hypothetical protein ACPGXX_18260 [Planctomycetaceae bacterium]